MNLKPMLPQLFVAMLLAGLCGCAATPGQVTADTTPAATPVTDAASAEAADEDLECEDEDTQTGTNIRHKKTVCTTSDQRNAERDALTQNRAIPGSGGH